MARDYLGSNNINLLQPLGQYIQDICGKDAAYPRYLSTKLSSLTRILFPKVDDMVLNYLNEKRQEIEPHWYMPIIPIILVNRCEGIGTGWSSFIPNYSPRDLIAKIRSVLKQCLSPIGKTKNARSEFRKLSTDLLEHDNKEEPIHPSYKGFKGEIAIHAMSKDESFSYITKGDVEIVNNNTIAIIELPIGKGTTEYKEFLESLKKQKFIKDFKERHNDTSVHFRVEVNELNIQMVKDDKIGFLRKWRLTSVISCTNMHLFDKHGRINKYATVEQSK